MKSKKLKALSLTAAGIVLLSGCAFMAENSEEPSAFNTTESYDPPSPSASSEPAPEVIGTIEDLVVDGKHFLLQLSQKLTQEEFKL